MGSTESDNVALNAQNATVQIVKAYPSPFIDLVNIDFTNNVSGGKVSVDIYDLHGKLVHKQSFGNIPAGRSTIQVSLNNKQLGDGIYLLKLNVNGKSTKMMKLVKSSR